MTLKERKQQVRSYLGQVVDIKIDRPIGHVHKKEKYSLTYNINYGFISEVFGGDGEELDVYLLGVDEAVCEYRARIIAIVHRENDVEDKLVAAPVGAVFSREEIRAAVDFQEQYYTTYIETEDSVLQLDFADGAFLNLPREFREDFPFRTVIPLSEDEINFYTAEEYEEIRRKSHTVPALSWWLVEQRKQILPPPDGLEDYMRYYLPTFLYIYDGEVKMRLSWEGKHLKLRILQAHEWE